MNDIRSKFEEIWPVPVGLYWCDHRGEYMPHDLDSDYWLTEAAGMDMRLDTFTRCQEATAVYLSLIEELVQEVESCHADLRSENWYVPRKSELLERAKQKLEQIK